MPYVLISRTLSFMIHKSYFSLLHMCSEVRTHAGNRQNIL